MYLSEFVQSNHRGPYLGAMSCFWMFGALLCGGLAWLLLPLEISGVYIGSLQIHSWRVFLALSAIPSIVGAGVFFVLPESPRFLLEVRKAFNNSNNFCFQCCILEMAIKSGSPLLVHYCISWNSCLPQINTYLV